MSCISTCISWILTPLHFCKEIKNQLYCSNSNLNIYPSPLYHKFCPLVELQLNFTMGKVHYRKDWSVWDCSRTMFVFCIWCATSWYVCGLFESECSQRYEHTWLWIIMWILLNHRSAKPVVKTLVWQLPQTIWNAVNRWILVTKSFWKCQVNIQGR